MCSLWLGEGLVRKKKMTGKDFFVHGHFFVCFPQAVYTLPVGNRRVQLLQGFHISRKLDERCGGTKFAAAANLLKLVL